MRFARTAALAAAFAAGCTHRAPVPAGSGAAVEPSAPRVARFTPIPETEALHSANPHDHAGSPLCQRCHRPGEAGVVAEPIALCTRCHDPGRMKHPFGVRQPGPSIDLPLGEGGIIVCHTCHDPHSVKARPGGLRIDYRALCAQCHVAHGPKKAPAGPR
jgi:predicted CXXCH cytochrome family protein